MNEVKLSIEVVNKVLNYLSTKPYKEVVEIIAAVVSEANKTNESLITPSSEVIE